MPEECPAWRGGYPTDLVFQLQVIVLSPEVFVFYINLHLDYSKRAI